MSRIMVVDDDPNLRELVAIRLQKAGHKVLTAGSAGEALAIVDQRGAPDLVVLDVLMPGMTGFELLPALR
jgi:CheY-like chemotaxis protein